MLRDTCGFPGMRILQNGFRQRPSSSSLSPSSLYPEFNLLPIMTIRRWSGGLPLNRGRKPTNPKWRTKRRVLRYLGTDGRDIHWDVIRLAMSSVAPFAMVLLQNVLGWRSECWVNRPALSREARNGDSIPNS